MATAPRHAVEPEPVAAWATDCRDKYAAKSDNPQDKTYPGNHDSGYAGRVCMADGALAWCAVVSDGAGGSEEGLKISAVAVQAFVQAVAKSSLAELSSAPSRDAWVRAWTKSLHSDVWARFKGGYATLCGAVILPPPGGGARPGEPPSVSAPGWTLFSFNVGDSQVLKLAGDGKCMGIVPDAPPNNANVDGHNPIRVVGKEPKGDFALVDVEEFPLPETGPCWVIAGSDGFFSKKKGKNELAIFSSGDFRDVCLSSGAPFHELPALALRRSLENARKLDAAELMDNATVAMLGFRVPQTDLAGSGAPASPAPAPRPAAPAPAPRPAAPAPRPVPAARPAQGKGGAARTAFAAVAALVAGLAAGSLVFGGDKGGGASAASAESASATTALSPYAPLADESLVPDRGLCARCWKAKEAGTLPAGETPFHWASDCPHGAAASK